MATKNHDGNFISKLLTRQFLLNIAKYTFSISLITWLVVTDRLNFSSVAKLFIPEIVLVGMALVLVNVVVISERWRQLFMTQNLFISRFETFKLSMIGIFFNIVMPGGVGGDLIKGFYFVRQNPQSRAGAMSSVLMDRILGLYAMICMALVAMLTHFQYIKNHNALWMMFVFVMFLFLIGTSGLIFLFSSLGVKLLQIDFLKKVPLREKFLKLFESFQSYRAHLPTLASALVLSIIAQSLSILFLFYVGQKSGILDLPLSVYFFLAPLGFMATAIPISPAGVGVGQAAFLYLFNVYSGTTTDLGSVIITVMQLINFLTGLFGAYFYMTSKIKLPQEQEAG
jgi:uncharacterized protein (TIRG00374 family)